MKNQYWVEFAIYINPKNSFNPMDIYKILKLKPFRCKLEQKPHIKLSNKNWRDELDEYIKSPKNPENNSDKFGYDLMQFDYYNTISSIFTDTTVKAGIEKYAQKLLKKQKAINIIKKRYNAYIFLMLKSNAKFPIYLTFGENTQNSISMSIELMSYIAGEESKRIV